jgi:tRNA(Ile)-lysidine synthase TilS/MesJ
MQRCTRCILPESYPGISFDENGICNYCHIHKSRDYLGEEKLFEAIRPYRDSGNKYDCLVGYSGGRDSSFLLWYVVNKLKLKPLACFVDNGFVPDQIMENINTAVDLLGIDLVVKKHNAVTNCVGKTLKAWMRRPSVGMVGLLCAGCVYALKYEIQKTALEYQTPLVMFGLGEPEPPTTFAEKLLMNDPSKQTSKQALALGFFSKVMANPFYMHPVCISTYMKEFAFRWVPPIRKMMTRPIAYPEVQIFAPFYYIEWDEKEISSIIENKLGWKKCTYSGSSWRADCEIATIKNYLYSKMLGFTKLDELKSNMIRYGLISRDEALANLDAESVINEDFVAEFLNRFGIELADLEKAVSKR